MEDYKKRAEAYRRKNIESIQEVITGKKKSDGTIAAGDNQGEGYQMPTRGEIDADIVRDSALQERNAARMEALRRMDQADEGMAQMQANAEKKAKFEELRKRMRPKVETFPAIKPEDY